MKLTVHFFVFCAYCGDEWPHKAHKAQVKTDLPRGYLMKVNRFRTVLLLPVLCASCRPAVIDPSARPPTVSIENTRPRDGTRDGVPEKGAVSSAPGGTPADFTTGTVYYIRPDGGSADECTGLADAPYSQKNSPACAWNHPFQALPPMGSPRIARGDTLIIAAGEYEMGFGAPGSDACDSESAYDCHMPPIPGGIDAGHPTRILGEGWSAGCPDAPELWGAERADFILNLAGSSHVEIACLDITDHSDCVESQDNGLPCERENPPYGDWAATGIFAEDSRNVHLADLNIHGLADSGVHAGRLSDWTVERVRIAANGWAGWDGDIGEESSNSGKLFFHRLYVEWNGCGETYPGGGPTHCWAQSAGGYGDGLGTGATGGVWIFEDSAFLHNTSDGLDLLYARLPGAQVEIRRTVAEGNAGNQIKTTGPAVLENVIAVGNCGFFEGKPFTYPIDTDGDGQPDSSSVDPCRAGGDAIALDLNPGDRARIVNSTIGGEGGCLVIATCANGKDCAGGDQKVEMVNSIFEGSRTFFEPDEDACFAWWNDEGGADQLAADPFAVSYSIVNGVRFGNVEPCAESANRCGISAGIRNSSLAGFDAHLLPGSPAVDSGSPAAAPPDDFDGRPRDSRPDIGAYEWRNGTFAAEPPLSLFFIALAWGPAGCTAVRLCFRRR
jgi:hypothetical protein